MLSFEEFKKGIGSFQVVKENIEEYMSCPSYSKSKNGNLKYLASLREEAASKLRKISDVSIIYAYDEFWYPDGAEILFDAFLSLHEAVCLMQGKDYLEELPQVLGECSVMEEIRRIQSDEDAFIDKMYSIKIPSNIPLFVDLLLEEQQKVMLELVKKRMDELGEIISKKDFPVYAKDEYSKLIYSQFEALSQIFDAIMRYKVDDSIWETLPE